MNTAVLEAELAQAKRYNRELRNELAAIESGARRSTESLKKYNEQVQESLNSSTALLLDSQATGLKAIELQAEIDRMYIRFKEMELANKKIRDCNNKRYYEFSNYNTVRKIVQGLMDNLDLNMVSDSVIYKSVETQHLKTPDYWLTCVLLAIMAWRSDDRELAERAILQAIRLDKKNSSVFLMLFNLRMDRNDAALKWFYTYQECPLKGSDQRSFLLLFALMSKTVNSSENLSDKAREEIHAFIERVIQANISAQDFTEDAVVDRVRVYYDRMDSKESAEYPLLQKYSGDYPAIRRALMAARGNVEILSFLKKTIHINETQRNNFVKNYIDELTAQPNSVEKQVSDEIAYNEQIIRCQGNVQQAKEIFEAQKTHDETDLNLIAEMIDWIFSNNPEEIDGQGKLNMLTLTKQFHEKAIERHTEDYRKTEKKMLRVHINDYSATEDLTQPDLGVSHIRSYYEDVRREETAKIKNTGIYIGAGLAVASLLAAIFTQAWALLAGIILGAGYALFVMLSNKSRIKTLDLQCETNIHSASEILRKISEEHAKYMEEYNENDQYIDQIKEELANL